MLHKYRIDYKRKIFTLDGLSKMDKPFEQKVKLLI